MTTKISLDQLQVASPCSMAWDAMTGNRQVRFCNARAMHMYNFAEMTTEEGLALSKRTEGKF